MSTLLKKFNFYSINSTKTLLDISLPFWVNFIPSSSKSINFNSVIPNGTTTTLPILVSVNNQTLALTNSAGTTLTVANIANTLTFDVYFDKQLNVIRVTSVIS